MTTYFVGTDGGFAVDMDELLEAVAQVSGHPLAASDRATIYEHVSTALQAGNQFIAIAGGLSRRIGEGKYLGVGDISLLGLGVLVGPILHVVGASIALRGLRRLITFDQKWRPHLIATYATLDGLDREVFEAIHELQSRWVITNFDALDSRDFDRVYAQVAPTASDVRHAVAGDAAEVDDVLARLVGRRVLATDGDRYRIRF